MENIKVVRIFVLKSNTVNGAKLFLHHGYGLDENGKVNLREDSMRWMIKGLRNPMPVRNGTWFSGMSQSEMLKWFSNNGYAFYDCVPVSEISATPTVPVTKGNDEPAQKGNENFYDSLEECDQECMDDIICYMSDNGYHYKASKLYKMVHGCTLYHAAHAVREMCDTSVDI